MSNLVLVAALCFVSWRLVKVVQMNRKQQQLIQMQQQAQSIAVVNQQLTSRSYATLGQSIAALNIQLQVASKLWQVNPTQAQSALSEAYTLSIYLMQEIRHTVKLLNQSPPDSTEKML